MKNLSVILVIAIASVAVQGANLQRPIEQPLPNALRSQGCFKSVGELVNPKGYPATATTSGFCNDSVCNKLNATVLALKGADCYCGFTYPPLDTRVDDSNCDYPCPGFGIEACGGIKAGSYYSVFNRGIEMDVPYYSAPSSTSSTSGSAPTTGPTQSQSPTDKADEKKANIGGIVGGVVVAVVAVAGAIGGVFFYLRRKRNKEIEEEHRRNAAVNSFIGHKPPGSSGGLSITDARLDPVMAQRRLSDGSIADNHDYSRKILRVTNA